LFSHLFLVFGVAGKGCCLVSAAWAVAGLLKVGSHDEKQNLQQTVQCSMNWAILGFVFFTMSMFAGELWSYRVWGAPVAWEDPAITCAMATWFFYIGLLHLHLTGYWSLRRRAVFAASGALMVIFFNIFPDLGPFRWPF